MVKGLNYTIDMHSDLLVSSIKRSLGNKMKESIEFSREVYSAFTNITWIHKDGTKQQYGFRAAGDLISSLRGEGSYEDWYGSAPEGNVTSEIAKLMKKEGWKWTKDARFRKKEGE